jgi:hypothetical protein
MSRRFEPIASANPAASMKIKALLVFVLYVICFCLNFFILNVNALRKIRQDDGEPEELDVEPLKVEVRHAELLK